MNISEKVSKKAFQELRLIQNSKNMMEVYYAMSTAIQKTFGLQNIGLLKVAIEMDRTDLMSRYDYYGKNRNIDLLEAIRYFNLDKYGLEAKKYIMTFIPERMHKSIMYQDMILSIN